MANNNGDMSPGLAVNIARMFLIEVTAVLKGELSGWDNLDIFHFVILTCTACIGAWGLVWLWRHKEKAKRNGDISAQSPIFDAELSRTLFYLDLGLAFYSAVAIVPIWELLTIPSAVLAQYPYGWGVVPLVSVWLFWAVYDWVAWHRTSADSKRTRDASPDKAAKAEQEGIPMQVEGVVLLSAVGVIGQISWAVFALVGSRAGMNWAYGSIAGAISLWMSGWGLYLAYFLLRGRVQGLRRVHLPFFHFVLLGGFCFLAFQSNGEGWLFPLLVLGINFTVALAITAFTHLSKQVKRFCGAPGFPEMER